MARWAVCWLLVIVSATAAMYFATNTLIAVKAFDRAEYAMLPLGGPGSAVCQRATRALVAAGPGAAPDASNEDRAAYDSAAKAVLSACGRV